MGWVGAGRLPALQRSMRSSATQLAPALAWLSMLAAQAPALHRAGAGAPTDPLSPAPPPRLRPLQIAEHHSSVMPEPEAGP